MTAQPDPASEPDSTATFVQLLLRHESRLRAYLMSLLAQWDDVDEVLQQTSVTLWKKFDQFEPGTDFFAWAARTAHFTTLNFLAKQKRSRLRFSPEFIEALQDPASATSDGWGEREAALADCMKKLSDADRDLIARRYAPAATTKDVATSLGRPLKSVYKSLGRIYKSLLACVERTLASESGESQ
jgi:RNA polymerase sigma-70 factor (ECF subfamily)